MRILIFSWRDIKNPKKGGAEVLTMELAKRWAKANHQVTIVSSRFPKSKKEEVIDRVKIVRPAPFENYSPFSYLTYLFRTIRFYKKSLQGKNDIILDQVHGLPIFSPFFAKEKVVLFPLEVAQDIWKYEVPFPFWVLGQFLELLYVKLFRKYPFLTISNSCANELYKLGVKNISILTPGVNLKPKEQFPRKTPNPTLVSLGRLTPMKRVEETMEAFAQVAKEIPQLRLFVVGDGKKEYVEKLKGKGRKLGLSKKITFTGFISEKEKEKLLACAWVLVATSLHEGWGLNVIEAAACGTPTIAYKVPGLVDSVLDGKTGLLCQKNTPQNLTENTIKLLSNNQLRLRLSQNALEYSRNFSWDKAAKETLEIISQEETKKHKN